MLGIILIELMEMEYERRVDNLESGTLSGGNPLVVDETIPES
jgi:hypothetical protein